MRSPNDKPPRRAARLDVGARPGPALDQARRLEIADGAAGSDARDPEQADEVRFAREAIAALQPA